MPFRQRVSEKIHQFVAPRPRGFRELLLGDQPVKREAVGGTAASFMTQRQEFLRNVLIGASLYDLVLVYAPHWHEDIEKLVGAMRPDSRSRIILIGPPGGLKKQPLLRNEAARPDSWIDVSRMEKAAALS